MFVLNSSGFYSKTYPWKHGLNSSDFLWLKGTNKNESYLWENLIRLLIQFKPLFLHSDSITILMLYLIWITLFIWCTFRIFTEFPQGDDGPPMKKPKGDDGPSHSHSNPMQPPPMLNGMPPMQGRPMGPGGPMPPMGMPPMMPPMGHMGPMPPMGHMQMGK